MAATSGYQYDATDEATDVVLGDDGTSVVVPATMTMGQLATSLARHGVMLEAPPTSIYPTVGGFLACAGHGSAHGLGSLSGGSTLTAIELVDPSGRVHELSAEKDREQFDAARVSLGAFGLIRSVTLTVTPGSVVSQRSWLGSLDEALDAHLAAQYGQFESWWFPYTEHAQLIARDHHAGPPLKGSRRRADWERIVGEDAPLAALRAVLRRSPGRAPWLMDQVARRAVGSRKRVGSWDLLILGPRWMRGLSMEFAIPQTKGTDAIAVLQDLLERHLADGFALDLPINLRWAAADGDSSISPNADRAVLFIDVTAPSRADAIPLLLDIETAMTELDGRPHWGKLFFKSPIASYPHWTAWERARQSFDPEGHLLSPYLNRVRDGGVATDPDRLARRLSGGHLARYMADSTDS